jgi:arylamine N-acetyltransferase
MRCATRIWTDLRDSYSANWLGLQHKGRCPRHWPPSRASHCLAPCAVRDRGNALKLSEDLLERVHRKLGLFSRPSTDLTGLNQIYSAYSGHIPNDNIHKRIWLAGDKSRPVTGGDPAEFFENWLAHGTGGTCFPAAGALCAMLIALGFLAHRTLGSVMMEGIEQDGNHGTVLVLIGNTDYLVDPQLAAFSVLPLVAGQPSSTGEGIHDIRAVPHGDGLDVHWYPGSNRRTPMVMRLDLPHGRVDHGAFLAQYALSALRDRKRSPFNEALFIGRHFPDRILNVGRNTRTEISAANIVTKREITVAERTQILVEEFGISAEIVKAIPPDEDARN